MTRVKADQAQGAPVVSITRTLSLEIENDHDNGSSVEFIMTDTPDNRFVLDDIKRAISNASKHGLTILTDQKSMTVNAATEMVAKGVIEALCSDDTRCGYQLQGEWFTPSEVLPELAWYDDTDQL